MINVGDDQRGALDHKHTYIHVPAYGIVPAGWLLSPFLLRRRASRATAVSFLLLCRY